MHKHWLHTALAVVTVVAALKYAKGGMFGTTVASFASTIS